MRRVVLGCIGTGLGLVLLAAGAFGVTHSVESATAHRALKSNDLTGIRKEALSMFPRGTRLEQVAEQLAQIGFQCEAMRQSLGDISAPALLCASNGRGYPDYPAVNLTVSTRNGLVSEIEVWNVMQRSESAATRNRLAADETPVAAQGVLADASR